MRKAGSLDFVGHLLRTYDSLPEFLEDDVTDEVLVSLGAGITVALTPNQDPEENGCRAPSRLGEDGLGPWASHHHRYALQWRSGWLIEPSGTNTPCRASGISSSALCVGLRGRNEQQGSQWT